MSCTLPEVRRACFALRATSRPTPVAAFRRSRCCLSIGECQPKGEGLEQRQMTG